MEKSEGMVFPQGLQQEHITTCEEKTKKIFFYQKDKDLKKGEVNDPVKWAKISNLQ